jgi:hypothetical protein
MGVARVVQDEIEEDLEATTMGVGDEPVEVLDGPEQWVDCGMVGDVVAEVSARGGVDGREPDRIDAEGLDVVEMGDDAGQVADAITVAVGEAPGVDLVDDPALPPVVEARVRARYRRAAR